MPEIDKPLLLSVLRKIESRGAIETARRIKQRVAAIYRYANAEGSVPRFGRQSPFRSVTIRG
ncbi:hypothetical protein AAG614_15320 [Citromicrobium bathyomarinum]